MYASLSEVSISGLPHYHVPRFVSTLAPLSNTSVSGPAEAAAPTLPATNASVGPGGPERSAAGKIGAVGLTSPTVAAFPVAAAAEPTLGLPDQRGSGEMHVVSSVQGEREQLEEQMKRRHISPLAVKKAHSLFGRGPSKSSGGKAKSKSKSKVTKSPSKSRGVTKKRKAPAKKSTKKSPKKKAPAKSKTKSPAKKRPTSAAGKKKKRV